MRFCLKCGRWIINSFYWWNHKRRYGHNPLTVSIRKERMKEYINLEQREKYINLEQREKEK